MIFAKHADPRLVTIRRGGTLTGADHALLALWAADCAGQVLRLFEQACPNDIRPRAAVDAAIAWARNELSMTASRSAGGHAMASARALAGAPRFAAFAAGQAGCVAHVAAHELGAAAYAIKAVQFAAGDAAARRERDWQCQRLPEPIRELVLSDQALRDEFCWSMFSI